MPLAELTIKIQSSQTMARYLSDKNLSIVYRNACLVSFPSLSPHIDLMGRLN